MAVIQLAEAADVVKQLGGRALTDSEVIKVEEILDKASELFRRRSGQDFTAGTSEVRLKVNAGRVYLEQYPVTAVTTVVDDDGNDVPYTRTGQWLTIDPSSPARRSDRFVTVNYAHGGEVPDLVRLCIADVARQILEIDPNAVKAVTQHSKTTGPFTDSFSYASWAIGGATRLSPEDNALADSYKKKVPTTWVQSS
jgi:hypothetical protein